MLCIEKMDKLLSSLNFETISSKKKIVDDIIESIRCKKRHNHLSLAYDNKRRIVAHGLNFFVYGKNINIHSEVDVLKKIIHPYFKSKNSIHLFVFRFTSTDIRFSMPCKQCHRFISTTCYNMIKTLNYSVSSDQIVSVVHDDIKKLNCTHLSFYQACLI